MELKILRINVLNIFNIGFNKILYNYKFTRRNVNYYGNSKIYSSGSTAKIKLYNKI